MDQSGISILKRNTKKSKSKKSKKTRKTKPQKSTLKRPTSSVDVLHEMKQILRDFNPYHKSGQSRVEYSQPMQSFLQGYHPSNRNYDHESTIKDLKEQLATFLHNDKRNFNELIDIVEDIDVRTLKHDSDMTDIDIDEPGLTKNYTGISKIPVYKQNNDSNTSSSSSSSTSSSSDRPYATSVDFANSLGDSKKIKIKDLLSPEEKEQRRLENSEKQSIRMKEMHRINNEKKQKKKEKFEALKKK